MVLFMTFHGDKILLDIFEAKCPFSGSDEKLVLRNSKLGNITYSP